MTPIQFDITDFSAFTLTWTGPNGTPPDWCILSKSNYS